MNNISDVKRALRQATIDAQPNWAKMLSAPDQCEMMQMLVKMTNSRKGIEVGVFTGYSALCLANGLPEDGQLIACDVSEEFTSVGRPFWEQAGVANKIDLRIAPALETLIALNADPANHDSFDFAYIDADKLNYANYVEQLIPLLKSNGFIMLDNMLWKGKVADPEIRESDADTKALYDLSQSLKNDERIDMCSLMLADGFTMARKK